MNVAKLLVLLVATAGLLPACTSAGQDAPYAIQNASVPVAGTGSGREGVYSYPFVGRYDDSSTCEDDCCKEEPRLEEPADATVQAEEEWDPFAELPMAVEPEPASGQRSQPRRGVVLPPARDPAKALWVDYPTYYQPH